MPVAGRQKDDHVAIDRLALEIAFEGGAVNLDVFNRDGLGAWERRRHDGLHLRCERCAARQGGGEQRDVEEGACGLGAWLGTDLY